MARKRITPTAEPPQTINFDAAKAQQLADKAAKLAEVVAKSLALAELKGIKKKPLESFWLAPAQRDVLLAVPGIPKSVKTKLRKKYESFTFAAVAGLMKAVAEYLTEADPRTQIALQMVALHLLDRLDEPFAGPRKPIAVEAEQPLVKADPGTIYQFKITLLGSQPPIWRRIQVTDCTLDKLHEHIQTAMGWTNSHLHHFRIGEQLYGDPVLMEESIEEMNYKDSTRTKISKILPKSGRPFSFTYEYDFGDGWEHDVLFEGCPKKEPGQKYPLCLEGERACPPEDCGGIGGFYEFLEALADAKHEEHENMQEWIGGSFDPEKFDAKRTTREMKKGLPEWRE